MERERRPPEAFRSTHPRGDHGHYTRFGGAFWDSEEGSRLWCPAEGKNPLTFIEIGVSCKSKNCEFSHKLLN